MTDRMRNSAMLTAVPRAASELASSLRYACCDSTHLRMMVLLNRSSVPGRRAFITRGYGRPAASN